MKIAIATDGNQVSGHFGHCAGFTLIEAEGGQITGREFVSNPGHRPGFLPVFLGEKGVNVIISGGMGGNAVRLFEQNSIKVVTGASGDVDKTARLYLDGQLRSTDSACHEHQHAGECGGHQ